MNDNGEILSVTVRPLPDGRIVLRLLQRTGRNATIDLDGEIVNTPHNCWIEYTVNTPPADPIPPAVSNPLFPADQIRLDAPQHHDIIFDVYHGSAHDYVVLPSDDFDIGAVRVEYDGRTYHLVADDERFLDCGSEHHVNGCCDRAAPVGDAARNELDHIDFVSSADAANASFNVHHDASNPHYRRYLRATRDAADALLYGATDTADRIEFTATGDPEAVAAVLHLNSRDG